ncbi:L-Aspartase-like protein, partial [Lipomyces japonicus]|uniref:L-Aspartase-like protein n=1 Tax=Lipomyces japonicus TaxID=56871 RepID=UPI0034CE71F6
ESRLTEVLGSEIAGCLSIGLSRIDLGTTVRRLSCRHGLMSLINNIVTLQRNLLAVAKQHKNNKFMTYTHMQHAQPGNLAHFLESLIERFNDNIDQLIGAYSRVNRSPLGAAGLTGTSLNIDRMRTAELLGCDGLVFNSRLGRDAAYAAELACLLSATMSTANLLACDLHYCLSSDVQLLKLSDDFKGTSSIFPQKINPVTLEIIKWEAGLATHEGTGDQALQAVPVDQYLAKTTEMVQLLSGIVSTLQIFDDRIDQQHQESWSATSALADAFVRKQTVCVSNREAHHVMARYVKICNDHGLKPADVRPEFLSRAGMEITGKVINMTASKLLNALNENAGTDH